MKYRTNVIKATEDQKILLRAAIEEVRDVPAFQAKKEAIMSCIDEEKSKEGILKVTILNES